MAFRRRRRPGFAFIRTVRAKCGWMIDMLTRFVRRLRRARVTRRVRRVRRLRRARRRVERRVRVAVLRRARRRFGATATLRALRRSPFSAARRRADAERRVLPGRPAFPARLRAAQYRASPAGCPLRRFLRAIAVLLRARWPRLTDFVWGTHIARPPICSGCQSQVLRFRDFLGGFTRFAPVYPAAGCRQAQYRFSAPDSALRCLPGRAVFPMGALPRILSPRCLPLT